MNYGILRPGSQIGSELSRLMDEEHFVEVRFLDEIAEKMSDQELDQVAFWLDKWRGAVAKAWEARRIPVSQ